MKVNRPTDSEQTIPNDQRINIYNLFQSTLHLPGLTEQLQADVTVFVARNMQCT